MTLLCTIVSNFQSVVY